MKTLHLSDLFISLFFGLIIFVSCLHYQHKVLTKTQIVKYKKYESEKTSQGQNKDPKNYLNTHQINFLSNSTSRTIASPNDTNSNFSEVQIEPYDIPVENYTETDLSNEDFTSAEFIKKKTEEFIVDKLGLPLAVYDRVIESRNTMEAQINRNNQQPQENTSGENTQELNQRILAEYQEELIQTLGAEGFQKFTQWHLKLEADVAEMRAGGRVLPDYL